MKAGFRVTWREKFDLAGGSAYEQADRGPVSARVFICPSLEKP
jgi:hypothetical protein